MTSSGKEIYPIFHYKSISYIFINLCAFHTYYHEKKITKMVCSVIRLWAILIKKVNLWISTDVFSWVCLISLFPYSSDRLHWYTVSLDSTSNCTLNYRHICVLYTKRIQEQICEDRELIPKAQLQLNFDLFNRWCMPSVSILWAKWQI